MSTVRQCHRQTDGQTDGRLTNYDSNTALSLRASHGKNYCTESFGVVDLLYYNVQKKLRSDSFRNNRWYYAQYALRICGGLVYVCLQSLFL